MRILITGSRDWDNAPAVVTALADFLSSDCGIIPPIDGLEDVTLVHGACPSGADDIADKVGDEWAWRYGLNVERHPADWDRHGRRAGFVRNAEMVKAGANICLAFIRNNSKGATMTADLAEKAGIPVRRFTA